MRCHTCVGSMTPSARAQELRRFTGDDGPPVILVSLRCGGTGLTITRANHVFLMDQWWNSAIEEQAIDRVHRIGQKRPVHVTRYVVNRTIEERVEELKASKEWLAKGALRKLSPEEARILFFVHY